METLETLRELLLNWIAGTENEEEVRRLNKWAEESGDNKQLLNDLKDDNWLSNELGKMARSHKAGAWEMIEIKINLNKK